LQVVYGIAIRECPVRDEPLDIIIFHSKSTETLEVVNIVIDICDLVVLQNVPIYLTTFDHAFGCVLFERQISDEVADITVHNKFERRCKFAVDALKISTVAEFVIDNQRVFGNAQELAGHGRST